MSVEGARERGKQAAAGVLSMQTQEVIAAIFAGQRACTEMLRITVDRLSDRLERLEKEVAKLKEETP